MSCLLNLGPDQTILPAGNWEPRAFVPWSFPLCLTNVVLMAPSGPHRKMQRILQGNKGRDGLGQGEAAQHDMAFISTAEARPRSSSGNRRLGLQTILGPQEIRQKVSLGRPVRRL